MSLQNGSQQLMDINDVKDFKDLGIYFAKNCKDIYWCKLTMNTDLEVNLRTLIPITNNYIPKTVLEPFDVLFVDRYTMKFTLPEELESTIGKLLFHANMISNNDVIFEFICTGNGNNVYYNFRELTAHDELINSISGTI